MRERGFASDTVVEEPLAYSLEIRVVKPARLDFPRELLPSFPVWPVVMLSARKNPLWKRPNLSHMQVLAPLRTLVHPGVVIPACKRYRGEV